jgi:hypothetical protein
VNTHHNPKQNPNAAPVVRTLPVKIVRGYWPLDGGAKIPAGTETELPLDEAKGLIADGVAVRNDALPA